MSKPRSSAADLAPPPTSRAWSAALAGMLALASSLGIGRFVYTPILPPMAASLGLTAGTAGLIASGNFAGYLLGAVIAAMPTLPGSRRLWFVGGLVVSAATTIAMGGASGLGPFLALRFLGGAASAFVLVLGTSAVLDALAAAGRHPLSAIHYGGVGFGIALSAIVVSTLEAAGAGWRVLWIAAGAAAAVMAIPPALALRWRRTPQAAGRDRARIGAGIFPLTVCHFLFGFGYVVTATFMIAIVRASPSGRTVEPMIWTIAGLAAMPSMLFWNRLSARFGARAAYATAAILESAGVLLAGWWPNSAGLLLAAVLFGGTFMGLTALGFAVAREFGVDGQERRFAVITIGFGLGQALGPVLGGAVSDWTGSFWVASVVAACALGLAAILIVASGRHHSRH